MVSTSSRVAVASLVCTRSRSESASPKGRRNGLPSDNASKTLAESGPARSAAGLMVTFIDIDAKQGSGGVRRQFRQKPTSGINPPPFYEVGVKSRWESAEERGAQYDAMAFTANGC